MALVGAPSITPRWEWRCFGADFGEAEATLTALTPEQVVESTELYLVSAEGRDVVKVRDGLMDIKQLQRVDDDGLEQWAPLLKAPFPLAPDMVGAVAAALGVPELSPQARTRSAPFWRRWSRRTRSCARSRSASAVPGTSSADAWPS